MPEAARGFPPKSFPAVLRRPLSCKRNKSLCWQLGREATARAAGPSAPACFLSVWEPSSWQRSLLLLGHRGGGEGKERKEERRSKFGNGPGSSSENLRGSIRQSGERERPRRGAAVAASSASCSSRIPQSRFFFPHSWTVRGKGRQRENREVQRDALFHLRPS